MYTIRTTILQYQLVFEHVLRKLKPIHFFATWRVKIEKIRLRSQYAVITYCREYTVLEEYQRIDYTIMFEEKGYENITLRLSRIMR